MPIHYFDSLAESLCENCAKRKEEMHGLCKYLFEWGKRCAPYQEVFRVENNLKEHIAYLIQFQNKVN